MRLAVLSGVQTRGITKLKYLVYWNKGLGTDTLPPIGWANIPQPLTPMVTPLRDEIYPAPRAVALKEVQNISQMMDQLVPGAELEEEQVQYLTGPILPPTPAVQPTRQPSRTKSPKGEKSKTPEERRQQRRDRDKAKEEEEERERRRRNSREDERRSRK